MEILPSTFKCYSAGPDLFRQKLADGRYETWEEAAARVQANADIINAVPEFKADFPLNSNLTRWDPSVRACACLYRDLLYSTGDIIFANVTPFGGREPDSGTVVEVVTCALNGGLVVLWSKPLTTFAEKYADADVHPESELDDDFNLMLEQLFYGSWRQYFGHSHRVFSSLEAAVAETANQVRIHWRNGFKRIGLLDRLREVKNLNLYDAVDKLLAQDFNA